MKKVALENVKTGARKEFPFEQAENILKLEAKIKQKCHKLPDDSKFTFTDGKLIENSSGRVNQNSETPKGAKQGKGKKTQE